MSKHVAFTEQLERIRAATEKLNDAASEASKLIEATEKALVDLDPGIRVYGDSVVVDDSDVNGREVLLGFDKTEKRWGFVIREITRDGNGKSQLSDEVRLLRKADREVRVVAAPRIESLMNAIVAELDARVSSLLSEGREAPVGKAPVGEAPKPNGESKVKSSKKLKKEAKAKARAERAAAKDEAALAG